MHRRRAAADLEDAIHGLQGAYRQSGNKKKTKRVKSVVNLGRHEGKKNLEPEVGLDTLCAMGKGRAASQAKTRPLKFEIPCRSMSSHRLNVAPILVGVKRACCGAASGKDVRLWQQIQVN